MMLRLLIVLTLVFPSACSKGDGAAASEETTGGEASYGRQVDDGLLVGGQPTPEQLKALAEAGYRTVITLRTAGEVGGRGEREIVEGLKMRFVSLPISGPDDLTVENAQALAVELAAVDAAPVLLHCGSANRAAALLGLKEFAVEGADPATAIDLAKKAGMTKLEPALRDTIKQLCEADVERNCSEME